MLATALPDRARDVADEDVGGWRAAIDRREYRSATDYPLPGGRECDASSRPARAGRVRGCHSRQRAISLRMPSCCLEGHCLKIVGSQLLHLLDGARPGVADRLAAMTELADALRAAERQAGSANTAKQRGL